MAWRRGLEPLRNKSFPVGFTELGAAALALLRFFFHQTNRFPQLGQAARGGICRATRPFIAGSFFSALNRVKNNQQDKDDRNADRDP